MKKKISLVLVIVLIGAIYFLRDYVNPRPLKNTIWVEKDNSKNPYIRPNSLLDTCMVLSTTDNFIEVKSSAYGLIFNYRLKEFKAKYDRCLDCEVDRLKNK